MVKPELHLSDEGRKVLFEATMVHLDTAFCIPTKVFNAVDVNFLVCKGLVMANMSVLKTFEVYPVIDLCVGVDPGLWPHMGLYDPVKGLPVEAEGSIDPEKGVASAEIY